MMNGKLSYVTNYMGPLTIPMKRYEGKYNQLMKHLYDLVEALLIYDLNHIKTNVKEFSCLETYVQHTMILHFLDLTFNGFFSSVLLWWKCCQYWQCLCWVFHVDCHTQENTEEEEGTELQLIVGECLVNKRVVTRVVWSVEREILEDCVFQS